VVCECHICGPRSAQEALIHLPTRGPVCQHNSFHSSVAPCSGGGICSSWLRSSNPLRALVCRPAAICRAAAAATQPRSRQSVGLSVLPYCADVQHCDQQQQQQQRTHKGVVRTIALCISRPHAPLQYHSTPTIVASDEDVAILVLQLPVHILLCMAHERRQGQTREAVAAAHIEGGGG
jgi:hypothetical protein